MKKQIPKEINYAEAYLTFRCGLGCSYCINRFGQFVPRDEMPVEDWLRLNQFQWNNLPLTLGGGEPTKHPEFFEIVDGLEPRIDLLTNLSFDVERFIKRVDPDKFTKSEIEHYHPIRASYHAERMDRDETIKKAKRLQNAGFNIGIFGVRHPYNINDNMAMAFKCAKSGVPFYEKDFLGKVDGRTYGFFKYPEGLNGGRRIVECKSREILIAPNGDIHKCHRDLYAGEFPTGNLKRDTEISYEFRPCATFGECNPCDLKLKTNKYLKNVECQVEIIE